MGQRVSILIVFSSEAFLVIFASQDGTFLWPFCLVSKHMSLEVLEDFAAIQKRTSASLAILTIKVGCRAGVRSGMIRAYRLSSAEYLRVGVVFRSDVRRELCLGICGEVVVGWCW